MLWIAGDDPDAATILAAYWPHGGSNRPPSERKARALQALTRARPDMPEAEAQEKVNKIVDTEQEEHEIATMFCQMALFYVNNISRILEDIHIASESIPKLGGVDVRNQSYYIWSSITALLSYTGSLHRILIPQQNIQKREKDRKRKIEDRERRRRVLQFYLDYDETILRELNRIRGIQQHFDEHIDEFIHNRNITKSNKTANHVADHGIIIGSVPKNIDFLRSFNPSSLTISILDKSYCLKDLMELFPLFVMVVSNNVSARGGRYHFDALSLAGTRL